MNVEAVYRNDPERGLDDPLPEKNGVVVRFIRGDMVYPIFGNWFTAPWPKVVVAHRFRIPLPFIAWKFGPWLGYVGAKVYRLSGYPAYENWLPAGYLTPGSMAFTLSIRPFASRQ